MDNLLQLFHDHSRKIATVVSILLIVLMSLSVARSVLLVMETTSAQAVMPDLKPMTPQVSNKPAFKVSNLELFGRMEEAGSVPETVDAPETNLNLELQGVFISDDPKLSTAIVAEKNKDGELFAIGDRLPGNATLAAVHQDHVLIRRGTRMEKLLFSDTEFRFVSDTPTARAAEPTRGGLSAAARSNLENARNRIRNRLNPGGYQQAATGTGTQLAEYRERLRNDLEGTLSQAGITPVTSGESSGYQIGEDAEGAIRQAGLQPGDVILSINGRPVGQASSDSALMDQVMASSRVRVEVQRGTRRFFLTVPVPK